MSDFLKKVFKLSLFACLVLVFGAWFQYSGKSVSSHIESQVRKAKRWEVTEKVTTWSAGVLKENVKQGEEIQSSEREKLKRLISDLNR